MMTSKTQEQALCSLLFETTPNYSTNLQTLLQLIEQTDTETIVLAHEVCLTGFDYDNLDKATAFSEYATEELLSASKDKTVVLTMLEKREGEVFNVVKVFHNEEIIHERAKARLFRLGSEEKYMSEGNDEAIELFEIDGIKCAIFICFELRFKELWIKAEGADVILVPAWWGKPRSEHFKTLTQALAIMNQCYLVCADALNAECSAMSAIISPQGEVTLNGNKPCLVQTYNQKNITLMRRYIDIGIE
ncbi:carbon-nitrogen hydrolase family protein [Sulfurimonas sp. SAG-AH-194-C21]|nr:nitrilase-related carbon-nitrogen hydrolase [Sulfurimonas sp. SAG-AH-194-C21]MDF1883195.1 carbon-nitrogen hydrolase family protein [Sulfurimonas sp. SAG-AH-194-C21]